MEYIVIYLLTMLKLYKLKTKDSDINATLLCLGNVSKNFSADNLEKTGLYGYIYDCSVDYDRIFLIEKKKKNYDSIDVANILDIHKYLMKKKQYEIMFGFIKKDICWIIKRLRNRKF